MSSFAVPCNNKVVLLLCVVALGGYIADAALTVQPSNTVALEGTNVRLQCTTDKLQGSEARITWVRNGDPIVERPCQPQAFFPQYSVINDSAGQCDLVINNASLELAATYGCGDLTRVENAELTVIESCLTGSHSSFNAGIGDTITMTCTIKYSGSSVPVLQWSSGDGTGELVTDCSSSNTVCSSLSVNIASGMTTVESQSCSVMFPSTVRVHLEPQCLRWNSTKITVSYLSTLLTVTGAVNNSDINLDSQVNLECHADGYPTPNYRWLDGSATVTSGPIYTISAPGDYSLECTASNDVTFADGRIVPHSVSTRFYINATGDVITTLLPTTSTPGSPTTTPPPPSGTSLLSSTTSTQIQEPLNLPLILGLSLGIGIPVIILIFVLLLCCCCPCCLLYDKCHKKAKQDRYEAGPSEDSGADTTNGHMPMTNMGYRDAPSDPHSPDILRDNKPYSPDKPEPVVYAQLQYPAQPRSRTPIVEPSNAVYGQILKA